MKENRQWQVEVQIKATVARVWDAIDDLSLIPAYHPVVRKVEYLSGQTRRAAGVAYKCVVPDGRRAGWCVEKVIEHVPGERMTVSFPEDSWGMSRMFDRFTAETTVGATDDATTRVRITASYLPKGFIMRTMNALGLRRMMRKRARLTLEGLKRLIEDA